jgi:hypothetical protein
MTCWDILVEHSIAFGMFYDMLEDAMTCWNLSKHVGIFHGLLGYPMTHWNMPVEHSNTLEHSIEGLCTALVVLGMFLEHSRPQTQAHLPLERDVPNRYAKQAA